MVNENEKIIMCHDFKEVKEHIQKAKENEMLIIDLPATGEKTRYGEGIKESTP